MRNLLQPWYCSQVGAREHYAIPRTLHAGSRLAGLFTDAWVPARWDRWMPRKLKSLTGRFHPNLASARVVAWTWSSILQRARLAVRPPARGAYEEFLLEGGWFGQKVRNYLRRIEPELRGKIIFSYDTTALELFEYARTRGAFCVLGQMDPARVESDLVLEEQQKWPGWAIDGGAVPEAYHQRREAEWKLAHRIVVNSRWSANALVQQGVPPEKLAVIPLCYEPSAPLTTVHRSLITQHPLKVLFLGQVILRKGIQYLLEAASLIQGEAVRFEVVGPIGISEKAISSAPFNVTFHGRVNRDETANCYRQSDVFVLPTISDGFAITQIEAMAHGLPVIATPCCGEVVSDGADGFLVAPRDPVALAAAIRRYLKEPYLLSVHSAAALEKSHQFTLSRLAANLLMLGESLITAD